MFSLKTINPNVKTNMVQTNSSFPSLFAAKSPHSKCHITITVSSHFVNPNPGSYMHEERRWNKNAPNPLGPCSLPSPTNLADISKPQYTNSPPIPVAARCKSYVCGHSLVGIAGSNPLETIDVRLVARVAASATSWSLAQSSPTGCLCLCVI